MRTNFSKVEVRKEFERAEKALRAAQILLKDDLLEDAISRAYYAILHAAKAVLLVENINVESHRAVKRLLGQHLIQTGRIDAKYSRILAEEQDDRYLADYDVIFSPERERVQQRVEDAVVFLNAMKSYLEKHGITL
ncbi:MAG: HEPN domain-containing protein [Nitrospirota bacterium]